MFGQLSKKVSVAVVAAVAGLFAVQSANAGSVILGNSGWLASWDASLDGTVAINYDFESSRAVYIEKFINFTRQSDLLAGSVDPVAIVFTRVLTNATPYIVMNDEILINNTGLDWTGFEFTLLPGNSSLVFDQALTEVAPPGNGFSIGPFTTHTYNASSTILTVGGGMVGTQPGQNIWFPGTVSGGLAIQTNASGSQVGSFTLKEMPIVVPSPMAAWGGLVGLAVLGVCKRFRKPSA